MPTTLPSESLARDVARAVLGWPEADASRFTTGMAFFVYDVSHGSDRAVVRMGRPEQSGALRQGQELMETLRPLGVPLPAIFATGEQQGVPYIVMERLAGTDLGHVLHELSPAGNRRVAEAVADAQLATARSGQSTRFGYAATPEQAPHDGWAGVIAAHIDRSRRLITANGLFPLEVITDTERLFAGHRAAIDAVAPTPFLHDTTTKNVIVSPAGTLSGIVDVDDLCYGDPRYAAALTATAMLGWDGAEDYVAAWLARIGLTRDALFEFYVATFLLDFMAEHGTRFNGNEVASTPEARERLSRLYQEALRRAAV
ncbi:phosphotransferase family protein [Devosia lacusdianchii]|uniref:phosphotransferase family protein n=1 Tax=Devosia lacusdianchii TaxID=2917991 RepID=UPI001F0689C4|nr:aminoglycoside phosphotransferase family protein [Devosia sp. JXJ CY 41]